MGISAFPLTLLLGIVVLVGGAKIDSRVNLLQRSGTPKVGLEVEVVGSAKKYNEECDKEGLMAMLEAGAKGKVVDVDESGQGSVLFKGDNGDEAWVPIKALVGFENWVKGQVMKVAAPAPAVPAMPVFAGPAPAVDTNPTDFLLSGCQQAKEVKTPFMLPMGMTKTQCFINCQKQKGMKYFAMTTGSTCFCSAVPPGTKIGSKECDMPCTGNPHEICGGLHNIASVYTMMDCTPPTPQEKGFLAHARFNKLASLYERLENQSCAQKKNNACELNGSTKMNGTPDQCKIACWEAKGSAKCDGFTYNKVVSRCTFFKDVLDGEVKQKVGLECYYKKLGFPML